MTVAKRAWCVGLSLCAMGLGGVGCLSVSGKATDLFRTLHKCEQASATARADLAREMAPYEVYEVSGCGTKALYQCSDATRRSTGDCYEMTVHTFEATDGSVRNGKPTPWKFDATAQEDALLASAAHDLPCDRGAIRRVGNPSGDNLSEGNILDGCGQRVTYRWTYDDDKHTGRAVLVGKVPTGAAAHDAPR
jgi:hypothetical protein